MHDKPYLRELTKNGRPNESSQIIDEPHINKGTDETYEYACVDIYASPENPVISIIDKLKLKIPNFHPNTWGKECEE